MDKQRELEENAIRSECIESLCDDLTAIKAAAPTLLEVHIVEAAYRSAVNLGWAENERELKWIFRRVVSCLQWPLPKEIA